MRSSSSRPRGFPRFVPNLELLEERNPSSLLWLGAAGATAVTPPAPTPSKIGRAADVQPVRLDSLDAILTPTNRLSLAPADSASGGGSGPAQSEGLYTLLLNPDSGPTAADSLILQLDLFARNAASQSGGAPASSAAGIAAGAGSVDNFAAPAANALANGSAAPVVAGSGSQAADALFMAVSASSAKASGVSTPASLSMPMPVPTPVATPVFAEPLTQLSGHHKSSDPLFVLDANRAIVITAGNNEQEFSTWSMDLRAQVSGSNIVTYSWNVMSAADAQNVTGGSTYRLQFNWRSFTGAARTNTITITTTDNHQVHLTQTLTFVVAGTDSPAWTSTPPTSFSTWPNVASPDQMTDRQQTADSQFYSLGLATGEVMTQHNLPGFDPGVAPLQLDYGSLAANPKPIFLTHFTIDPSQAVPATVSAKLTFNAVAGSSFYYNTSQLNPGDILEIGSQGDATGLSTGRYSYSVAVTANYGTPVTTTYSGSVNIVNSASSPFGAGWSLAGYERVWSVTGGILLELPGGLSLWFAGAGPSYTTPAGDFSTLVKNGDGTYTRTMKDGTKYNFSTAGLQTSFVDRDGNTTAYGYNGSSQLTAITDLNSLTTTLAYNGSGKVTSFADPASRTTTLGYDVSNTRLTSITDPDTALWGYGYDTTTNRLTGLTDPRINTTTFAYNFAGRVSTVTRPDLTTEGLTALQMSGLVQSGQGTQSNPAAPTLAVQGTATYTDPRNNNWLTDFDWLGFGTPSQQSDPLSHMTLTYRDANALGWLASDPLARRTRFLFDSKGNPTEFIYPDDTHEQYSYNSFSEPTQHTDPGSNVTTYGYDTNGNLTSITQPDPDGGGPLTSPVTSFGYNAKGFLTTTTDPDNHTTTFGYDTRDRMTSRTDALTHVATYGYDSASNQTSVTDERNNVTTNSFDNMHRLTGLTLPDSNPNNHPAYTYTLDPDGNVTGNTDPLNHTTTYTFDKLNRETGITDPLSHTTTLSYDNAGNQTGVTDALSHTTTYTFDTADRVTGVTDALNHTTTYGYDAASQLSSMKDALLRTTTYSYSVRGWQSGVFDPIGNSTKYSFNSSGDQTLSSQVSVQNGSQLPPAPLNTTYTYDNLHRVTQMTDPKGNVTTYGYDSVNNLTNVTEPLAGGTQNTVTYGYDALNRMTSMTDELSHTTTYGYDNVSNQTTVTDALSHTTTSAYDPRNRLTSVTDPRNGVTSYVYDFASRLTSITDSVNNSTTYGYDNANRLTSVTDPNNHATTYGYDNANRLTGITDRDGRTRTFTYDNANRKTNETWVSGSYTATYTYDVANQLTGDSDAFSAYTYTYDTAGRLKTVDNNGTPSAPHLVLTYSYDGFNNLTIVADSLTGAINYGYDNDHNLTSASMTVSTTQGPQATLSYDTRNRRTGITRSVTGTTNITSSNTFDDANRLTNLSYTSSQAGSLASYTYGYDAANQLTSYSGPDGSLTYGYDTDGQLTGVSGAHAETYTYDTNGNRTMSGYSTGTGNRLTNDGTYSYTYDNEGNTLTQTRISDGQVTSFTWDYHNRLTEVVVKTSGGTTLQDDRFTYDVENRRIGKNTLSGGQTWTAYDGDNAYADFNSSLTLTYRYLSGRAIDSLLARWDGTNALWYLTDKLGSVRQDVTTSGSVSDQIVYDSYGNILSETSPSSGDRFKYTGREWDAQIGLYYYRARYVSALDGRFENEDPSGFDAGDADLFRYVRNGPTNGTDPYGLDVRLESSGAICGLHRRVCVDLWNDANEKVGTFCISFAINDNTEPGCCCGSSNSGGGGSSGSSRGGSGCGSGGSSGSGSSCTNGSGGGPAADGGSGSGSVYIDESPTVEVIETIQTTPDQDRKVLEYLRNLVGRRGDYDLLFYNCRTFSRQIFEKVRRFVDKNLFPADQPVANLPVQKPVATSV